MDVKCIYIIILILPEHNISLTIKFADYFGINVLYILSLARLGYLPSTTPDVSSKCRVLSKY